MLTLSALILATVLGAPSAGGAPSAAAGAATAPRDPFVTLQTDAARPMPIPSRRGELRDPFRSDPARRPAAVANRSSGAQQLRDPFARDPARRPRANPEHVPDNTRSPFALPAHRAVRPPAPAPVPAPSPAGELVDPFVRAR